MPVRIHSEDTARSLIPDSEYAKRESGIGAAKGYQRMQDSQSMISVFSSAAIPAQVLGAIGGNGRIGNREPSECHVELRG